MTILTSKHTKPPSPVPHDETGEAEGVKPMGSRAGVIGTSERLNRAFLALADNTGKHVTSMELSNMASTVCIGATISDLRSNGFVISYRYNEAGNPAYRLFTSSKFYWWKKKLEKLYDYVPVEYHQVKLKRRG